MKEYRILVLYVLLTLGLIFTLTNCVKGGDSTIIMNGILLDTPTTRQPVPDAQVLGETQATTDPEGRFTVEVPEGTSQLVVQFSDGSQNIYDLSVLREVNEIDAEFFSDPIVASTETPGVTILPIPTDPAGIATITAPQNDTAVVCAPLPEDACRFRVEGVASTVLGQPRTSFIVYVVVIPGIGEGAFPQFPPVNVDPASGQWTTEAVIGSAGGGGMEGDFFQIVAIVTDEFLEPGPFPRVADIPGVVHISSFINLTVGSRS